MATKKLPGNMTMRKRLAAEIAAREKLEDQLLKLNDAKREQENKHKAEARMESSFRRYVYAHVAIAMLDVPAERVATCAQHVIDEAERFAKGS